MVTISALAFNDEQQAILNSVMPGGDNWKKFRETKKGNCLESCLHFKYCNDGHGPDKICSEKWSSVEQTPAVLEVLLHVVNHFDYYNQSDLPIESNSTELVTIREKVQNAQLDMSAREFEEGKLSWRMHYYRERNSEEARRLKENALKKGTLRCQACEIDFFAKYGEAAKRIIECHHTVPLSSEHHKGKTKITDLVLLCANCHSLAHSSCPPILVPKLKKLVNKAQDM